MDSTTEDEDVFTSPDPTRTDGGVLHFAGHGQFNIVDPEASHVVVDRDRFSAKRLLGRTFRHSWLVFLNACETGLAFQNPPGMSMKGWPGVLCTKCQCGAFIGAQWQIANRSAHAFAMRFYRSVAADGAIGKALRTAREGATAQAASPIGSVDRDRKSRVDDVVRVLPGDPDLTIIIDDDEEEE